MSIKFKSSTPPTLAAVLIEPNGKKRNGKWINCLWCKQWFVGRLFKGVYPSCCSRKCTCNNALGERIELFCSFCNKSFTRPKALHLRSLEANKTSLVFCSRSCKDKAQSLESNFPEIRPDHYGTGLGVHDYRVKAFSELGIKCVECDMSYSPILEIHHKDGNRYNNVISNLEVLCANHHLTRHMRFVEGMWVLSKTDLSPRDKLVDILSLLQV